MDNLRVATWRLPHCTTPQLEAVARLGAGEGADLPSLRDGLGCDQLFYLSTCQRVLLAFTAPEGDTDPEVLQAMMGARLGWGAGPSAGPPELFAGEAAFRHLSEVAASLDSLVPGEPQVLGQFKEAYRACQRAGLLEADLAQILPRVLRVAKRVRSRTRLFTGSVSILPLTTRFLREAVAGARRGCGQVAVVGTGPIGQALLAKLRRHEGLQLYCVSHSRARAEQVAGDALSLTFDEFLAQPPCLDALALATRADEPYFGPAEARRILGRRCPGHPGGKLRVLDLAMPRNARPEAGAVAGCELVQMDELVELAEAGRQQRREALEHAREVLDAEMQGLHRELWKAAHKQRVVALRERLERTARERLARYPGDLPGPRVKRWMDQTLNSLIHVMQNHMLEALAHAEAAQQPPGTRPASHGDGPPPGHPGNPQGPPGRPGETTEA